MKPVVAARESSWKEKSAVLEKKCEIMSIRRAAAKLGIRYEHSVKLMQIRRGVDPAIFNDQTFAPLTFSDAWKLLTFPRENQVAKARQFIAAKPKTQSVKVELIVDGRPLLPTERAVKIKTLESQGLMKYQIASVFGVDPGLITLWSEISNYIAPIARAIDANEITLFSARCFRGMSAKGQKEVWNKHGEEIKAMSGPKAHKLIADNYSVTMRPDMYTDPVHSLRMVQLKEAGRNKRANAPKPRLLKAA